MSSAVISYGPKLGLLNNASIGDTYYDQFRPFMRGVDALVQISVISVLSTPPSSPNDGDSYIIGATPSGEWTGKSNEVAVYSVQVTQTSSDTLTPGWDYYTPQYGWLAYNAGLPGFLYFMGTWAELLPVANTSVLGFVKPDGTTISITDGTISGSSFQVAGTGLISSGTVDFVPNGGIQIVNSSDGQLLFSALVDNSSIAVNGSNQIYAVAATESTLGVVRPDNSTITISGGVLTAIGGGGGGGSSNLNGPVNLQAGTTYTLQLSDAPNGLGSLTMNNATGNVVTLPVNASVAFPVGTVIEITQLGAGQTSITPASGVTIDTPTSLSARAQFSTFSVKQIATNTWIAKGDLQ